MESYNSIPQGYQKGETRYVVVTGSVMSGVGKGTFTSALADLLMFYGQKLSMIKFDGYLNVDAGTLNPYRHGEVFVLKDGTETDLDLGSYERALNKNLTKDNYLTGGKIFKRILEKERRGEYLGRDVQFLPHVTGEIKLFIRNLAMKDKPDMILIEVGGTTGDIENSYFIEAMRELEYEEGSSNVMFVNVNYIIQTSEDEQKSKAAQLGLGKLMSLGVKPELLACRCKKEISENIKEKLSLFSNVPIENVISFHDLDSVYSIPFYLEEQGVHHIIFRKFNKIPQLNKEFHKRWISFVEGIKNPQKEITIAITGKYTNIKDSYLSILKALEHCSAWQKYKIHVKWIETTDIKCIDDAICALKDVQGVIVPGGFGSRGTEGKIKCIEYARTNNIPFLGLCYGLQLAVIEYARNVCGMNGANSTEIENNDHPVIDLLPEQRGIDAKGATMRLGEKEIMIMDPSLAFDIYKQETVKERFRHRYEVNPEYVQKLVEGGIIFSGVAKQDPRIMQIIELPRDKHKFFFATQFHPELTSKPLEPNPVFMKFVQSCAN